MVFGILLLVFHPIQWFAYNVLGKKAHRSTVIALNFSITYSLLFLLSRVKFINKHKLPQDAPVIVVANHQSTYDIPPIYWFMRKIYPNFVSKIELGKGIPSVSYNLRKGESVLIDRKDSRQAISTLMSFGKHIEKNKLTAVIFPEGTRSRSNTPKRFRENGLKMLTRTAPSAYVIPVSIHNSWQLVSKGAFPLGIGIKITMEAHKPIAPGSMSFEELMPHLEKTIADALAKVDQ